MNRAAALLLYLAMGVVLLADCYRDLGRLGARDWSPTLGQAQAELTSLLDHGQFPAWNPWRAGGQVSFAQPQSMFLSPVTPLALLTGVGAAFQLWLLPLFVIGALGMHALAGRLGLTGFSRLVPGAVLFGSSIFPLYTTGGMPPWLFGMALLPWLFLAHRKSLDDHRFVAAAGAAYAALLWCGNVHHFVYFPLLCALDALMLALQRRRLRPLLVTAAWMLAGVALAAVRVVPVLDVFTEFPRSMSGRGEWIPLALLPRLLFGAQLPDLVHGNGLFVFAGSAIYWFNCGAFIGWVAGLLALLAVIRAPRRTAGLLLLALVFAWMALGSGIHPSLWDALHRLPVMASMHSPGRLMLLVVFALALLAGSGFAVLEEALRRVASRTPGPRARTAARAAVVVAFCAVVLPPLLVNRSIDDDAFPLPPPAGLVPPTLLAAGTPPGPFRQVGEATEGADWSERLYEAVLRNLGNPGARRDIPMGFTGRVEGEPGYRGEVHLAGGHGQVEARITPNRVEVTGELSADDRLVVNQSFFPGWRATGSVEREAEDHEGLLSLPLPAGRHELVLEYRPPSIALGFALQALAFSIVIAWWVGRGSSAAPPADGGVPVTRGDGLALAALAGVVAAIGGWHVLQPRGSVAPPAPDWRAALPAVGAADDLQSAVDAAAPGAALRLAAGTYRGVRITRGVTLVADPLGSVELGECSIEGLPAGETAALLGFRFGPGQRLTIERSPGTVILQSCEWVGPAPSLEADRAEHVLVVASRLAELDAADSRIVLIRCDLAPARISAANSVLLLHEPRAQPGWAIRLERSRLTLESSGPIPLLELRHGSTALLSGAGANGIAAVIDDDSRATLAVPPLPSVVFGANLRSGIAMDATVTGPPGARGTLFLSSAHRLQALEGAAAGQFLQTDLGSTALVIPVELPPSGRTTVRIPAAGRPWVPGAGLFVQLQLTTDEAGAGKLYSLADGSLIEPPP